MGIFGRMFGGGKPGRVSSPAPRVRARFDIAEKGDDARHWANADHFSMDGALTPMVRRTIRNRARYERNNNSYLAGIAETRQVTPEHFDIGHQMVAESNGLRRLQVGEARHHRFSMVFGEVEQRALQPLDQRQHVINGGAQVQPHVGGDLIVA